MKNSLITLSLTAAAFALGLFLATPNADSLEFHYNGAIITLPEEIDAAGTGDTLIVYDDQNSAFGRTVDIQFARVIPEFIKQEIVNEINAKTVNATDDEISLTIAEVLRRREMYDRPTLNMFLQYYQL